MDMSFDVQGQGFFDFGSFTPENMEVFWKSEGADISDCMTIDSKKGDFSKAVARGNNNKLSKKNIPETKNVAALKSHCEAERRRRERINSHLANLRNFVPSTDKMDKATLLAEVIMQVKELKQQALDATKGLLIPTDADEVVVVPHDDNHASVDVFTFRVSICSDYKSEIIPSLRRAITDLKLTIVKAEISTLGSRVKNIFTVSGKKDEVGYSKKEKFAKAIYKALSNVLEKVCTVEEYSPRTIYPSKRRRVSFLESSTLC